MSGNAPVLTLRGKASRTNQSLKALLKRHIMAFACAKNRTFFLSPQDASLGTHSGPRILNPSKTTHCSNPLKPDRTLRRNLFQLCIKAPVVVKARPMLFVLLLPVLKCPRDSDMRFWLCGFGFASEAGSPFAAPLRWFYSKSCLRLDVRTLYTTWPVDTRMHVLQANLGFSVVHTDVCSGRAPLRHLPPC